MYLAHTQAVTRRFGMPIAMYSSYASEGELKITIRDEAQAVTLKIEGKVAGAFGQEFRRVWDELAPSLKSRKLIVDLRGTTFLDMEARQVLAEIHAKSGAEFLAASPLTKYFAEEAMRRVATNGNWSGGYK